MALGYGRTGSQNFGVADLIVDASGLQRGATHTTIAGALADASANDTIFIRPGVYDEDIEITLGGIGISAISGNEYGGLVIIRGKITLNHTGTNTYSNIRFETDSDYCLEDTGSATGTDVFRNCYISMDDNDAINVNNANRSLTFRGCSFNMAYAAGVLFTLTSINTCTLNFCRSFGNATYGISTMAAGGFSIRNCFMARFGLSISGSTSLRINNSTLDHDDQNVSCVVLAGTSSAILKNSTFMSGSAQAITIGAGCTVTADMIDVDSSNSPAVGGAGTIQYAAIGLVGSNTAVTVTTETAKVLDAPSLYTSALSFDSGTNAINDYIDQGSWTPVLTASTTAPDTVTYNTQSGTYTRIGDIVFYAFTIDIASFTLGSGAGSVEISGLPITSAAVSNMFGGNVNFSNLDVAAGTLTVAPRVNISATRIRLVYNVDNGVSPGVDIGAVGATTDVVGSGWYFA